MVYSHLTSQKKHPRSEGIAIETISGKAIKQ